MEITVEISMYPLTNDYLPKIDAFIKALYSYDVEVTSTMSCTHVTGSFEKVMNAIQTEIKNVLKEGQTCFAMKILNGNLREKVDLSELR
jgi:uncharacterized protein YqgV (UPF0045/DUF77 family)